MARLLENLFTEWASTPFDWGSSDCAQSVFNYARHQDPDLPEFPVGNYGTPIEAVVAILRLGGLVSATSNVLVSWETPTDIRAGDIGVIPAPVVGESLSVYNGVMWVTKGHYLINCINVTPIKHWRFICPKQ